MNRTRLESENIDATRRLSNALQDDNNASAVVPSVLWVDKYRPRAFVDLLSDDVN